MNAAGLAIVNIDYCITSMDREAVFIPKSYVDSVKLCRICSKELWALIISTQTNLDSWNCVTLLMKNTAGPEVPDDVVGVRVVEVVAARTSLRILVFCLSVTSLYLVN